MANAVKRISVMRGHDVSGYTLQCFGGAGGQHAGLVADVLGMKRVFIHPLAGVLSAYGMGLADQIAMRESAVERELNVEGLKAAAALAVRLLDEAAAELRAQGLAGEALNRVARIHVRYQGTDTALPCALPLTVPLAAALTAVREEFESSYRRRFEFVVPDQPLVIEAVAVECVAPGAESPAATAANEAAPYEPAAHAEIAMYCLADAQAGGLAQRAAVSRPGSDATARASPDRPFSPTATRPRSSSRDGKRAWLPAAASSCGAFSLGPASSGCDEHVDPIMLELFNNIFMNIAEQMGLRLQNTAYSVNIKERLDFSCALFDGDGALIANAPHMPVHLGSMSESIRTVMERNPRMRSGDVYVLERSVSRRHAFTRHHRGHAGLFAGKRCGAQLLRGVARSSCRYRRHHARVDAAVLDPHRGRRGLDRQLQAGRGQGRCARLPCASCWAAAFTPRAIPTQNLADMRAQIAANAKGSAELKALVGQYGAGTVRAYMQHVQDNAEESVRRVITSLKDGHFVLPLDNGARIEVTLRVDTAARSARIDFSGTSAQLHDNFNAPSAVTTAAVLYVFRTLVDDDIPLNAGCLKPLQVILPEACMLNPRSPAAVVAGNVETSMCVTNALYGALGVMAAGCCTMSNFTFGNGRYQYYETIAGGSGAGPNSTAPAWSKRI